MATILSETTPVARKDYSCDAYWIILDRYEDGLFTYNELREIVKVRKQGGKILKGQRHLKVVGVWHGDFGTFRAHSALADICGKYDLYDED